MPDLLERLKSALSDRYAIESEIGRGGMAVVFLAEDLRHHRKVAIKVLQPELAAAVGPDRFLREIETVAGLRHIAIRSFRSRRQPVSPERSPMLSTTPTGTG